MECTNYYIFSTKNHKLFSKHLPTFLVLAAVNHSRPFSSNVGQLLMERFFDHFNLSRFAALIPPIIECRVIVKYNQRNAVSSII